MAKKEVPSDADRIRGVQRAIDALPTGISKMFDSLKNDAAEHAAIFKEYEREAEKLFEAVDGADLPTIEGFVRKHPPSPGAIGFLLLVARERYKSEIARKNALKRITDREPAKNFVLKQWRESGHLYKSKADFSVVIHALVRNEYPDIEITARTIEREWLPKGKPGHGGPLAADDS